LNTQKQPFLGTVIGAAASPLAQAVANAIGSAVNQALTQATANPGMQTQVPQIEKQIIVQEAVRDAFQQPELQHLTNSETRWYQKRSVWSAIVSGLTPFLAIAGWNLSPEMGEYLAAGLGIAGGLVASYLAKRAGTATKPLGA
jgi:hypothetical protein